MSGITKWLKLPLSVCRRVVSYVKSISPKSSPFVRDIFTRFVTGLALLPFNVSLLLLFNIALKHLLGSAP
jgi:hypothetical protein